MAGSTHANNSSQAGMQGTHKGEGRKPYCNPSPTFPAAVRAPTQHSKRRTMAPDTCPPFQALGLFVCVLPRLWHVVALLCSRCCLVSLLPLVPGSPCNISIPGYSTHAWSRSEGTCSGQSILQRSTRSRQWIKLLHHEVSAAHRQEQLCSPACSTLTMADT